MLVHCSCPNWTYPNYCDPLSINIEENIKEMNKREQLNRGSVNGNGNEIFSIIREWYYRELNIINTAITALVS